jgi:rhodanese-related sulfurtransferase
MTANAANAEYGTISKEELAQKIENAQAVQIVSILDSKYYNLGSLYSVIKTCASHKQENPKSFDFIFDTVFIKGSKPVMLEQLKSRLNEFDKNKEVLTYCMGDNCSAVFKAAEIFSAHGFKVRVFEGGIKEWEKSGLPTE